MKINSSGNRYKTNEILRFFEPVLARNGKRVYFGNTSYMVKRERERLEYTILAWPSLAWPRAREREERGTKIGI